VATPDDRPTSIIRRNFFMLGAGLTGAASVVAGGASAHSRPQAVHATAAAPAPSRIREAIPRILDRFSPKA